MKHLFSLLILSISFNAFADFDATAEKPFSLGVGTYRSVIAVDDPFYQDDELSGIAFTFGYAVSNNVAFRGTYFSLEHDDFSDIESTGFDFLAYFGTGLATQGFKAYIGGGLFKDKWEVGTFSQSFDGLQLNGGLGYNWESVSLDLVIGIRDPGDYEDFVNGVFATNFTATAISSSLLLSYRF